MQNGEGRLIGPNMGASMKRIIVLLVFSAFIAVPATAVAKQKSKQQTEADEIAKQHDKHTPRFARRSAVDPAFLVPSRLFRNAHGREGQEEA